jgi:hypothetical protein
LTGPVTIERLIADAIADFDTEPYEAADRFAAEAVPTMTTTLFQLVVLDNSLAFEESGADSDEPFAVLAGAVERRIYEALTKHLDQLNQETE